jgi:DNA replication protein DnaC
LTDADVRDVLGYFTKTLNGLGFNCSDGNLDAISKIAKNTFLSEKLRGFALQGNFDTGKTFFSKRFVYIANTIKEKVAFLYTANEMSRFFKNEDADSVNFLYKSIILVIDDVGTEPSEVVSFGTRFQPFSELIQQRYDKNNAIWFTTNIDQDSFEKVYGERITSRLKEMTYGVIFKGKDLYRGKHV